ncbi:MAG: hypothetical protein PF505_04265 [Vallitaleaceae bacterium]|jgi:hypothetical protein|nr:hypothetical protein [Vallitaleaceae bacterium]
MLLVYACMIIKTMPRFFIKKIAQSRGCILIAVKVIVAVTATVAALPLHPDD